jgi:hypothetical protein
MSEIATEELTIKIGGQRLEKIRRQASLLGVTTTEYVLKGIDTLLTMPEERFAELLKEMLEEDAELFRRLA